MANMINEDIAKLNGLSDRIALLASGSLTDAQARALMQGLIGEIKRVYSNLRYNMAQGTYGQGSFMEVVSAEGHAPKLAPLLANPCQTIRHGEVAAVALLERADVAADEALAAKDAKLEEELRDLYLRMPKLQEEPRHALATGRTDGQTTDDNLMTSRADDAYRATDIRAARSGSRMKFKFS